MDLLVLIAKAADVCLKPWSHAVVLIDRSAPEQIDDLHVRIERISTRMEPARNTGLRSPASPNFECNT